MDPNANLHEQEQLLSDRVGRTSDGRKLSMHGRIERLRELRYALHAWLDTGGFEPNWAACPRATIRYRQHYDIGFTR